VLLIAPLFGACLYFIFHVGRQGPSGFELPGARDTRRIKHLEAEIQRLDKAHLHAELGDIYLQRGKLQRAEARYRAAMERDGKDLDTQAHYGSCLVRLGRPAEALPLLAAVVDDKPRHDHGHTMMALAEAQGALGDADAALATWKRVASSHTYARARVQLAELLAARGEPDAARRELDAVLADERHTPAFQRNRERVWVKRARKLARRLPPPSTVASA
jgi:tetratricopeptide (TPR) repeat protein